MDPNEELIRLREQALTLEETIKDMDYEIERAMHGIAGGTDDVGHAMSVLTERRNAQLGRMFDLGKVTARLDDLENRVREQNEREIESRAAQEWQEDMPLPQEDHLDWLKPVLDKPEVERNLDVPHPHREGEERMLENMHREAEPEDYLDWWGKQ